MLLQDYAHNRKPVGTQRNSQFLLALQHKTISNDVDIINSPQQLQLHTCI